jgi:hypothetical protein
MVLLAAVFALGFLPFSRGGAFPCTRQKLFEGFLLMLQL